MFSRVLIIFESKEIGNKSQSAAPAARNGMLFSKIFQGEAWP